MVTTLPMGLGTAETILPATIKNISNVDFDITLKGMVISNWRAPNSIYTGTASFQIVRYRADVGEQVLATVSRGNSEESTVRVILSIPQSITTDDQTYLYKLRMNTTTSGASAWAGINDIRLTVTE